MRTWQAVLYLVAVLLLALAALGLRGWVNVALLGAACALLAFALPTIATL